MTKKPRVYSPRNKKGGHYRTMFDGRTLVLEMVLRRPTSDEIVHEIDRYIPGPSRRMTMGGVSPGGQMFEWITKTFINTDESCETVLARASAMKPVVATCGEVEPADAHVLWQVLREDMVGEKPS